MTAPFDPVTAFCVVIVTLSPTLLVLVQTFAVGVSESVVPAAIVPTAPPLFEPVLGRVTVFPLAVVFGVLGRVVELFVGREVDGRSIVRGVVRAGADVDGGFAGTSLSCGWAVVSPRFAIARSRPSADVSRLSALAVSCFELSALHAPSATTAPNASGATKRPIYFAIVPPSMYECGLTWSLVSNCRKNNNLVLAYLALKGKRHALDKGTPTAAAVLPPLPKKCCRRAGFGCDLVSARERSAALPQARTRWNTRRGRAP